MFVFGEPSFFNRDVPTIAYVWTATPVANGTVLRSQRYGASSANTAGTRSDSVTGCCRQASMVWQRTQPSGRVRPRLTDKRVCGASALSMADSRALLR